MLLKLKMQIDFYPHTQILFTIKKFNRYDNKL